MWTINDIYERPTREKKLKNKSIMKQKEKYIGAFLDGYFVKSKLEYNFKYFEQLEYATKLAKAKWKQYKKKNLL